MRIGIFTDAYDPDLNGVATSAKVLYEQFTKLGHQAYVVCTHSDKVGFKKEGDIIRLPGIELKNFYGYGIVPPVMTDLIRGRILFYLRSVWKIIIYLYLVS